jgi:hypothetical protein
MRFAKQIVFRYNGDPTTEEIDLDMDGERAIPEQRSLGERWKVVQVNAETSIAEPFEVPVQRFPSPTNCDFRPLSRSITTCSAPTNRSAHAAILSWTAYRESTESAEKGEERNVGCWLGKSYKAQTRIEQYLGTGACVR